MSKCKSRDRREAGFTLLELMVVIFIIALAAGIVLPRLPEPEGTRLKSSARNLASGLRFLNDQAIITKKVYRLHLHLGENTTRITELSPSGQELQPGDQFMGRRLIEDGIDIEDVSVPALGMVTEGEVIIPFGPGGVADGVTIHLKGGNQHYTVIANPSGGKVTVQDGYQEVSS
ncbi:prepilin-type N-terminal cleavage/methylation domain-containing protein [Geomonas anaerohicana]|uniref:Prepilin-type N-terminal cleavage/methylation domain-containing protein n=1 Tax=Geomonas anaerohicana TaxID=2798583 RepID=A0ABS0YEP8_9BACT|nr:prepilin-type N-terminal cleavage/methylation domain-containing protein [Geomonas anaerohicana]MBJ6750789.1 prepilin-type N-terminal cleavage/methylation domain-containing protein [Geomonas anaerohicana]